MAHSAAMSIIAHLFSTTAAGIVGARMFPVARIGALPDVPGTDRTPPDRPLRVTASGVLR